MTFPSAMTFAMLLASLGATAAHNSGRHNVVRCDTVAPKEDEQAKFTEMMILRQVEWEKEQAELETELLEGGGDGVRRLRGFKATVKVVFHALSDDGTQYVTDEQLHDQMNVLNASFEGTGFTFELDHINRVVNPVWYNFKDVNSDTNAMTAALHMGCKDTLNVYLIDFENLGRASYPTFNWNFINDGILLHDQTVPGGTDPRYNLGVTLVHEVGHWLYLFHTFSDYNDCDTVGDQVADTPVSRIATYGCPALGTVDTCPNFPGFDSVTNYMNYGDDVCLVEFTEGQIERMQMSWTTFRSLDGESCECPIRAEYKYIKIDQAKDGEECRRLSGCRKTRRTREKNYESGAKGGKGKKKELCSQTQTVSPTNVPMCNGIFPSEWVRWYKFEGSGSVTSISTDATNVYTTITVVKGGCSRQCVAATESATPSGLGDAQLIFPTTYGTEYLVAVTTFPYLGEFCLKIEDH